jgi:predicted transcriptional regulator
MAKPTTDERKSVGLVITMPVKLRAKLKQLAERELVSQSAIGRKAISEYVQKQQPQRA